MAVLTSELSPWSDDENADRQASANFCKIEESCTEDHDADLKEDQKQQVSERKPIPSFTRDGLLVATPTLRERRSAITQEHSPSQKKKRKKRRRLGLKVTTKPQPINNSWKVRDNERGEVFMHESGVEINKNGLKTPDYTEGSLVKDLSDLKTQNVTLGRGACGHVELVVYTGDEKEEETPMALKVVKIGQREKRHQVLKEIMTLYKSDDCPQLVDFYGAFYKDHTIHIALEYMAAGSLDDIIKNAGRIPERALSSITTNILNGLVYLHKRRKQVHRDIKPSNICINSSGEAKLTDFGIVAQLQSSMELMKTQCGTYTYMSPERIQGKRYSSRADIWSLGLCLYKCAVGQFPYEVDLGPCQLYCHVIENDPPRLPEDGDFSEDFKDFLSMCLMKDPEKRLSAHELLQHKWIRDSYGPVEVMCWLKEAALIE